MYGAEFRTLRQSLGLSQEWVARQLGIRQKKTISFWENRPDPVPNDAVKLVSAIWVQINAAATAAGVQVQEAKKAAGDQPLYVQLLVYRSERDLRKFADDLGPMTLTAHSQLLMCSHEEVTAAGGVPQFVYFEPDEYLEWLGARANCSAHRAQWASETAAGQFDPNTT